MTGAGAKTVRRALGFRFIQEEAAVTTALQKYAPQADIAIELGGENTRIFYRTAREEMRINSLCTAGVGFEIDEIAHLLHMNSAGLNQAAANHEYIYPLASRCGVYAKADIQPLINTGASLENLAASFLQSIVNQTLSDLSRGRPVRGCVTFLGGPLYFLPELTKAFIRTLRLQPESVVQFPDAHLYAAFGAAWEASDTESIDIDGLIEKLDHVIFADTEHGHPSPLFESYTEYAAFCQRHQGTRVKESALANYQGDCYLGIDAGSTITKLALIGTEGQLLFTSEAPNRTNQIRAAVSLIRKLNAVLPEDAHIVRSCVTGSGEGLLKTAFALDEGVVETVAHSKAVATTETEADCVLIFGGQGAKCLRLRDGKMVTAIINESCYSGSGTFLDSFTAALGYTAEDFTSLSLYAKTPAVFGTACMTQLRSRAIQAVYEGVSIADVSAGLVYSLAENTLLTLGVSDPREMGSRIVLHGGMFLNHAILRAFENLLHIEIKCPENIEIMGAFGAALIAREHYSGQKSTMLPMEKVSAIKYLTKTERCIRCSNNCILSIVRFSWGFRYVFGGHCAQRLGNGGKTICAPNLLEYKKRRLLNYRPLKNAPKGQIGLPRVLNIAENYPFWVTFFRALDFRVVLSPYSNREIYELGIQNSSPESTCYPAMLAQGHVQWLIEHGIETVFLPYITYTQGEKGRKRSDCPTMVITENHFRTKEISGRNVRIIRPIVNFSSEKTAADCLDSICHKAWGISSKKVRTAVKHAWSEQQRARTDIRAEGMRKLQEMTEKGGRGVVLDCGVCGMDSEINHGIPELIASYGLTVFTEDSIPPGSVQGYIQTPSPWDHNTNLLAAAAFVAGREDLDLIQLRSYGCALDSVIDRQVSDILRLKGKTRTILQLNEINNADTARVCIRSLLENSHTYVESVRAML